MWSDTHFWKGFVTIWSRTWLAQQHGNVLLIGTACLWSGPRNQFSGSFYALALYLRSTCHITRPYPRLAGREKKSRICEPGSLRVGLFFILSFDWTGRRSIFHTDVRLRVLWVNQRADQRLCFCCRSNSSTLTWERKMGEAWRGWLGDLIPSDKYIIHRFKCEDEYTRRAHPLSSSSSPQRRRNVSTLS